METVTTFLTTVPQAVYKSTVTAVMAQPRELYGYFGLLIAIVCFGFYLMSISKWVEANPNEWLLIIRNGKLIKAEVGLKTLVLPNETTVKFPSLVQRVEFDANNVTIEMQGVQIQGYAFWSVFREGDGPFKCYKYMQGGYDSNRNIRSLCESVIRNELANCKLNDVMKNRNMLRDKIKAQLQPMLQGWGIWLETVELTEVKICSKSLFEDLQAEFRQETHLKAEEKKLETDETLTQRTLESDLKIEQSEQVSTTQKLVNNQTQEIKRKQQEVEHFQRTCALEKKKIENDKTMNIERLRRDFDVDVKKLENEQRLEGERRAFERKKLIDIIERDKGYTDITLKKYKMESTERIFSRVRFAETKINQFVGDAGQTSLAGLLPGLNL